MPATYDSATVLAAALRRAEAAHGRHEEEIGIPTRTGRTGMPGIWNKSRPTTPARPIRRRADEQL
jgi:hypothetical protein